MTACDIRVVSAAWTSSFWSGRNVLFPAPGFPAAVICSKARLNMIESNAIHNILHSVSALPKHSAAGFWNRAFVQISLLYETSASFIFPPPHQNRNQGLQHVRTTCAKKIREDGEMGEVKACDVLADCGALQNSVPSNDSHVLG